MRRTLISLLLVLPACFGDEITGSARHQRPDPLSVRYVTIGSLRAHWETVSRARAAGRMATSLGQRVFDIFCAS
jgi:hypothetical protein